MTTPTGKVTGRNLLSEVAFLARELKTPVINETFAGLGDQARAEGWSHEEYLAAVLGRQVASRTANGTRMRIAAAHFPAVKTIEDFTFDRVPAATRDVLAHLATTTFIAGLARYTPRPGLCQRRGHHALALDYVDRRWGSSHGPSHRPWFNILNFASAY
jgi:tryptophan synthase beta subunit